MKVERRKESVDVDWPLFNRLVDTGSVEQLRAVAKALFKRNALSRSGLDRIQARLDRLWPLTPEQP